MATILVVDDEQPIRVFLVQALEDEGYRVLQAFNGRSALELIGLGGESQPDLVLSDVMMPVMGGVELCRALQADSVTARIPVVLMSAAGFGAVDGAGAAAFLRKPFDLDQLDRVLDQLLPGHGQP